MTAEQFAMDRAFAAELRATMVRIDRRFPVFAMAGVFASKEEKLLRLALDAAAAPGEIENAGRAFIASLRARGVRPETLITGSEPEVKTQAAPPRDLGSIPMPWGKYEGFMLKQIGDIAYLRWCLYGCAKSKFTPTIRAYLKQKGLIQ
jgi:hypothetical protein